MISKTEATGMTTYSWDYENRLKQVMLPNSGGVVSFQYDPFGRRIAKATSGTTNIYAYDGINLVEETDSSGGVGARYSQTENVDEPLAMLRSSATSYYEQDGLGSVSSLSDGAGALAQTYTFDSFGKLIASTGSLINPFQYTGREYDSETGLYYYRARYYDPQIGRFISEDPMNTSAGLNFYQYALNNPIDLSYPTGNNPAITIPWPWMQVAWKVPPAWLGPAAAVGGVAVGGWLIGRGIGHIPIGGGQNIDDLVQAGFLSLILLEERTIPKPARPKCGCACTCRADADDTMPGNVRPGLPRFAFGTANASSCAEASKEAKRIATINLGMKPKHIPCVCEGR
jgi:RHS repeat-associated protein